jgi:hypothetical protein
MRAIFDIYAVLYFCHLSSDRSIVCDFSIYDLQTYKKDKRQTSIYKTLHRKLKIEQHDPH